MSIPFPPAKPGVAVLLSALVMATSPASAESLAPFKDDLFAYPDPVAQRDAGGYRDVPYSEKRDIDERDEVAERRVRRAYVDLSANRTQRDENLETTAGRLRFMSVGDSSSPSVITVFVHGRNGDRRLGMNDWIFGGNFNRLKNLMVRNNGLYVTVDGGTLAATDATRLAGLLKALRGRFLQPRIVLACGSMGGQLCWSVLAQTETAKLADGLILMGSDSDLDRFQAVRKARGRPLRIVVAHGTRDRVYAFERQENFYAAVRSQGDPIRFVGFEGGNHGTPIRMIDWRDAINWILDR